MLQPGADSCDTTATRVTRLATRRGDADERCTPGAAAGLRLRPGYHHPRGGAGGHSTQPLADGPPRPPGAHRDAIELRGQPVPVDRVHLIYDARFKPKPSRELEGALRIADKPGVEVSFK